MDELLVKYLLGEANAAERESVAQWINGSAENRRYFEHFRLIWEESQKAAAESQADVDAAWSRFQSRTSRSGEADNVVPFTPQARRLSPARIAAAVMLLVTGSLAAWLFLGRASEVMLTAGGQVLTDTLPDGSVVTLNKNATLRYAGDFNGTTREVTLLGEAFFDVAPNKQKPFKIDANGVAIQVVGTSFNVKTSREQTEVIVETGVVRVHIPEKKVEVRPKQKALVTQGNRKLAVSPQESELYNYYRTREFVCKYTPLHQLVDALNDAYGSPRIIADARIRDIPITTTFRGNSLDDILKVITQTFNLSIEQRSGTVILK